MKAAVDGSDEIAPAQGCLLICTGERMTDLVLRLYSASAIKVTTFVPAHAKGLSNEFRCFANFVSDSWSFSSGI